MMEIWRILFILFFSGFIGLILARIFFHSSPKQTILEAGAIFSKEWEEKRKQQKKQIMDRFQAQMLELCNQESIYVEYFKDIYHLNEVKCISVSEAGERVIVDLKGDLFPENKLAAGTYVYLKKQYDTPEMRVKRQLPKIQLQENTDYVWTLAHELGHHFTIQYQNIETEAAADNYINVLAKQFLTKEEQQMFHIEIDVYSGNYLKK